MDPLILVDSSPLDPPHADRASITASAAIKPWTATRGTGHASWLPNIGHRVESNPSLIAGSLFGLLPLLYQYGSRPQLARRSIAGASDADEALIDAVTSGRLACKGGAKAG